MCKRAISQACAACSPVSWDFERNRDLSPTTETNLTEKRSAGAQPTTTLPCKGTRLPKLATAFRIDSSQGVRLKTTPQP